MHHDPKGSDDQVETFIKMKIDDALKADPLMLLRVEFAFQDVEHGRADVDPGHICPGIQRIDEEAPGADADFNALFEAFSPRTLQAKIADMPLAKLLYMVEQPHCADGLLNVDVNIDDARKGKLSGKVLSSITKGTADTATVEKAFEFTAMPKTTFTAQTVSTLSKDVIDTKVDLESTLAKLTVKQARYDVKKASLLADYRADVAR